MSIDYIFDLLRCDIDVSYGIENCDNNIEEYLTVLRHFARHSGFRYLNDMIELHETERAIHTARLLAACSKRLGAFYFFDLLHDLAGCLKADKPLQTKQLMMEIKEQNKKLLDTIMQYDSKVAIS